MDPSSVTDETLDLKKTLTGDLFRCIVGPDHAQFYIDSALLAHHSKHFADTVKEPFKEAQEKVIHLDDVSPHVFERVFQFIYTGQYKEPSPIMVEIGCESSTRQCKRSSATASENEGEYEDERGSLVKAEDHQILGLANRTPLSKRESKKKRFQSSSPSCDFFGTTEVDWSKASTLRECTHDQHKSRLDLWRTFVARSHVSITEAWEPKLNKGPCEDFSDIFRCHAELYVFADTYMIDELKTLTLHKLGRTLTEFHLYPPRILDIVELVEYTYTHTPDRDKGLDNLRNLVAHYAVCHIDDLMECEKFRRVSKSNAGLAFDLFVGALLLRKGSDN